MRAAISSIVINHQGIIAVKNLRVFVAVPTGIFSDSARLAPEELRIST
jgi:hypothetical protein